MQIKAMGIAGSPRRRGNSSTLMRAVLQGAQTAGAETETVYLNDLTYRGCQGCPRCATKGRCIQKDDLTPVFDRLMTAHVWVLAAPIYYDGVSGQMKLFFDRIRWLTWVGRDQRPRLSGKRHAAVILTWEDKPRREYTKVAKVLASYLGWAGDFGEVEIMAEGLLGPANAARKRRDLLLHAEALGKNLVLRQEEAVPHP
ncbi:MAG: flavodoxin family protein [Kiritimatiellae bacterium]|nr:flavodoxin family protein [Kiritimatiellia bacterium]